MPLQFDVNIFAAEYFAELPHAFALLASIPPCASACASGPSSPPVRQIRPAACFGDFFRRNAAFAFRRAQFHARDQAAKILIAGARFNQQRIAPAIGRSDFRADVRAQIRVFLAAR